MIRRRGQENQSVNQIILQLTQGILKGKHPQSLYEGSFQMEMYYKNSSRLQSRVKADIIKDPGLFPVISSHLMGGKFSSNCPGA